MIARQWAHSDDACSGLRMQKCPSTETAPKDPCGRCRAAQEAAQRDEVAAELLREEAQESAIREGKLQKRRKGKAKGVAAARPAGEHFGAIFSPASALLTLLGKARVKLREID